MNPKTVMNRLAAAAEIPVSIAKSMPEIRIIAMHTVIIEPNRGVRSFAGDQVLVETDDGVLCIRGRDFVLKGMNRHELRLTGEILALERLNHYAS